MRNLPPKGFKLCIDRRGYVCSQGAGDTSSPLPLNAAEATQYPARLPVTMVIQCRFFAFSAAKLTAVYSQHSLAVSARWEVRQ
jgi:hypothetical protein